MAQDWQTLTQLTQGFPILVERVHLTGRELSIEGQFELPPLACLSAEDQIFVAAFVRCHGSIKQMESYFGVSYPTIKNRLNRIGEALSFVKIEREEVPATSDVLTRLERGEITVDEALRQLQGGRKGGEHV
jgi:hypothetical protein